MVTTNVTDIKPPEMPQFDLDVTHVTAEREVKTETAEDVVEIL